jgi:hypothetical protein
MKAPRITRYKYEFAFGAVDTTSTDIPLAIEGEIVSMHVRTPSFTNNVTTQITLEDEDDYAYYQSAALARGANTNVSAPTCLSGNSVLSADVSGAAGGTGGTVTVVLFVKERRY